jgi:hypothetical protein
LTQPINESYQGLPPDLTGLTVEVVFSDSSTPVILREGDERWNNLLTVPPYCDVAYVNAGTPGDPSTYGLGNDYGSSSVALTYKGSNVVSSNDLKIPMVVKADGVQVTRKNDAQVNWPSDSRPDFKNLQYNVYFENGYLGLGTKSIKGQPNKMKTEYYEMTSTYPHVDYGEAFEEGVGRSKKITVFVGPEAGTKVDTVPKGGATFTSMEASYQNNRVETPVMIDNYYQIAGITPNGPASGVFYDDDVPRFYKLDANGKPTSDLDPDKVYKELVLAGVTFTVSYFPTSDGKTYPPRTITMQDFRDNSNWYARQVAKKPDGSTYVHNMVPTSDEKDVRGGKDADGYDIYQVLITGKDSEDDDVWRIGLDYAPLTYNQHGSTTVTWVKVPIYTFAGELEVTPSVQGTGNPLIKSFAGTKSVTPAPITDTRQNLDRDGANAAVKMLDEELELIQSKWVLKGVYEGRGGTQRKELKLDKNMFYAGYYGSSAAMDTVGHGKGAWASMNPWDSKLLRQERAASNVAIGKNDTPASVTDGTHENSISTAATNEKFLPNFAWDKKYWNYSGNYNFGSSAQSFETIHNFPLPIYYRGAYLQDDTGILVDVFADPEYQGSSR